MNTNDIVTRVESPITRYRLIAPAAGTMTAILRRVEWDADEAEWCFVDGSINFFAPAKWTIVPAANR